MKKKQIKILISAIIIILILGIVYGIFHKLNSKEISNEYTVTFKLDNEVVHEVKVKENQLVEEYIIPDKEKHLIDGWYLDNDLFNFNTIITEDITLNAYLLSLENKVVVTYKNNDEIVKKDVIDNGSYAKNLSLAEDATSSLEGWYFNDELYNFEQVVTEDITLTAHWIKLAEMENAIAANFFVDERIYEIQRVEKNSKFTEPVEPSKDGYIFIGWYLKDSNTKYDFNKKSDKNLELVAHFERKQQYIVSFYVNSLEYATYNAYDGQVVDSIYLDEENFKGWYYEDKLFDFSTPITKDIKLEAHFNE